MADKVQELLTLISALEMLRSKSIDAAEVYKDVIETPAAASGGVVEYLKEITENAELAAFALMQLREAVDNRASDASTSSNFRNSITQAVRTVESRRTGAPKRNTETTELTQDELQRAADQYALTTPDSKSKSSGRMTIKNNTPRASQPASDAPVNIIVSYLDKSGFFDKSDDYSDDLQEIVKQLQESVDDYKDPAQKTKKPQISRQIKTLFKKVTSASSTFSPTQVTNIQEDILKPVIEALKGAGADDEILQAGATRGASADAIKSAVQRVVSMLVTEQSGKAVRVGESVVDNDMLQILKPGALDRVIRNLGGIVRRSAVKTVVPRGQTASLHLLNVMEDALGDTSALTVESKRDNDIPSSSDALSNTRVFPQFITKLGAYFNKFRQSMRASLNPSLRYGPEAQGVDTRTGSQIVAGSSSAVFGGGMDAAVQQAVDRLLAQVGEDISKGSMATARIAGSDVQLPQTLAKMVVEAIQTSSVLSEHTTAQGRMAGDKGPRGALETGDPVRKLIALFAGDLINQYRSTGGVSADAAQNFMDQTVTPPQEHEVTLALTHAMRLRERLTFQRDRADLDMVTASPQVAGAYRRDSIQLTKQIQLLDELLKVSDDPEEEKKLALRRGQIALPMNEEQAALTRDQALTVLLRMPIGSVPAMPDAVAPIVQKAQQVSSGLRESGLAVPVRPSYGTSPVQSLVDFFSAGQTQSLEKFQPIPLTKQLDEVSAPTSGLEQKDIVAIISDAFGLSRQSGSQGNAITGIFYGARATDNTGRIKTGDDLDQALGGGYRTKNGLRSIVQASAEMQSYGSSGIPLIDYARLATATGRTEEEESMFEQVKAKLPHLGSIGEDQLKELAALDTSMDPQALIKRVMTLAAPAIQAHLTAFIKKQAKTAGMTPEQTEQLIGSGSAGENVPAGFESAFRVLQMFDPKNINSNDVTSEVNRAFSLFSTMLTDIVQPNESMPQLAARLLGRENRLEGSSAPVAEALPDKNASFALLRAGGEVADTEAHRVTGSVYSRSVANQNNLTEALQEFEKLKAEIAELQSDISLKPEEADKITPIINQKIDQLQQVRQKLRLYYAAEPDPISMKFEALSTIVQSDTASDTEKADAVRDLALMQTIFKHTGRYVIDESQGFGSGTQEQRLAALLEHTEKEEKLADLKRQRASLGTGGSTGGVAKAVDAVIEKSDIDGEIAAVTKDISAGKTASVSAGVQTFVPNYNEGQSYVNRDATIGAYAGKNPDYREDDPSQDSMAIVHDLEAQTLTAAISDGVGQSHRSNIASRLLSRAATTLPIDTPFTMENIVDRANASPLSDIEEEILAAQDLSGVDEGFIRTDEQLTGMSLKLAQTAIQRAKEKAAKEKREATVKDYYEAVSQVQDEASMSDEEYLKYFLPGSAFGADLSDRRKDLKDKRNSSSNATLSAYRRRFNPDTGKYEHSVVRLGDSPIVSPDLKLLPSDTAIGGQPSQTNTGPSGIVINNKPANPLFEQTYETDQPVGIVLASDAFQDKASTDILSDPSTLHRGTVNQSLLSRVEETPGVYSKKDDRSLIVIGSGAAGPSLSLPGAPETVTAAPETIDEEIARVQGEITALESPATKLAREAAERGVTGQGQVAGRTYVHPDVSHGEPLTYVSRRSTLPLTADYPEQISERFAKTGRIDISPEVAGSDAAMVVNAAVAETLGLPIGPEVMPEVSAITPDNVPDTSTSNQASAGAVPYFFVPGQSEPMVVVGQSTGAFKGRGVAAPVMGTVDPGQTQWQAAEREAQEELGVVFDPKSDVPSTIAPSTNDAFYMRRVQSISPASAHFETQGVQIVPLSVAINQLEVSRAGSQRDMVAGREALLALQAMVDSGEITNDQEETSISSEKTQTMVELTADLAQLKAKKQAAVSGEDPQSIVDEQIAVAEQQIAALEQELKTTEKVKTLQKLKVRLESRAEKKQKTDLTPKELTIPENKLFFDNEQTQDATEAVFSEVAETYAFRPPTEDDYQSVDDQIQALNKELKEEDDALKVREEEKAAVLEKVRPLNEESLGKKEKALRKAFLDLGIDMDTGEVSADSFLSGIDLSGLQVAAVSLVPGEGEIDAGDLVKELKKLKKDPKAQAEFIKKLELLSDSNPESSQKAKEREALIVKKRVMGLFDETPSEDLKDTFGYKATVENIENERAKHRRNQDLQKQNDLYTAEDEADAEELRGLGVTVPNTDTTSLARTTSSEIAKITLQQSETQSAAKVLSLEELTQLRNEKMHEFPETTLTARLAGQDVNLVDRVGYEAARQAQGMTSTPAVVPNVDSLLDNSDELLLDADGKPILLYRAEDTDQAAARLGEIPLVYEKPAVSLPDSADPESKQEVVFPTEHPTAPGGASRYGEGFYFGVTSADPDTKSMRYVDPERAKHVAIGYAKQREGKGMPSVIHAQALRKTAKLLDITKAVEDDAVEKRNKQREKLGLGKIDKADKNRRLPDDVVESLYREQVDPNARLRSNVRDEIDQLTAPYGDVGYAATDADLQESGVPEDIRERIQKLKEESLQLPTTEQLAVGMGYDAMRFRAHQNDSGTELFLTLYNPGQTVFVAESEVPSARSAPGGMSQREQTQVTSTERRAQELQSQLEQQKQQLEALKARSEALKQEAAAASTPSVDVTAVAEESKRVADETVKVSAEIKASTEEIQQREVDLDAQIAAAEKAVQRSRQQIAALQQQAEGNAGGDEEVYFTVDPTGSSVNPEDKQILDRTSLGPLVRTRMTAPDTGESLFMSNTNVPALVRSAQAVDPTTVDEVLASMTNEQMRTTGMPAAKLPEEFNWEVPSTLPKEWQKESGEPLTDEERKKLSKTPAEYDAKLAKESAEAQAEARSLYDKEDALKQAVQEFYATSSPDVRDSLIQKHSGLQERIAQITEAERKVTVADERRSALWSGARAAAEKDATPEQLVARLFRQSEKAVQEYADEFTTVPEFTARDVISQLVNSAAVQTSADAPATSPAVATALDKTLTGFGDEGLPPLAGPGGTMGEKRKRRSPAATVKAVKQPYSAGQLKTARKAVRDLSGRTDLTPAQRRRLSAARQKLHAVAIHKLTTKFGDNKGVMQIANTIAGLTPPDWAADPVQSARVSAMSEAMSRLSPFALKKLQDVDLTNSVELDRLSKNEELRPIMEMLASQDISQALNFKSGTQEYDTARGVLDAIERAKASVAEDSGAPTDAEEKKKLFFDLETTYGTDASTRKIYQAASGNEGEKVEEMFAVQVPESARAIQAVVADKTLTDDEKRKQIRELALKGVGRRPYVEGTDVNPKVIDRLVEHAMGGGTVYTQAEIKDRLKRQISQSSSVVGHNIAAFDLPVVYDEAVPEDVQAKTEDTLLMSRQAYPGDHSLSDTYMAVTGNPLVDAHDASIDTRAVQEVYPSLATDEERRKLRARYLASKGIAPDSTVAKLADIPELESITDDTERQRAFEQVGGAYTYYKPLAEMQDFTKRVVRSGGVTRIDGADAKQQAELFGNMNKLFGAYIKKEYGDGQTVETLDDTQLTGLVSYITDTYLTPNAGNAVDGDYRGMAQLLAGKMGGGFKLQGFNRYTALDKFQTLDSRLAPGAIPGLSYDPTATMETVKESIADMSAGKPSTVPTKPTSSTKPASTPTTSGTTTGGGVRPPGGGSGLTTAASSDDPGDSSGGGSGSGFSSIGQATIDSLHAQNVAIEINGGTVNIHANFTDSAASKMTKSLVYISNKDGMNVNGDVTSIGGGGGGGGYRRISTADRAVLNTLDAAKNEISKQLQTETDPAVKERLRGNLNEVSRQAIRAIVEPKANAINEEGLKLSVGYGLEAAGAASDSTESLKYYNEAAAQAHQDLTAQLEAQQAIPEGTDGRDEEIQRIEKQIAKVEELINVLNELNNAEQRVGSARGTRNIDSAYGTAKPSDVAKTGGYVPYRRISDADKASLGILESTKNSISDRLRTENDPAVRESLRKDLTAASLAAIDAIITPKASKVLDPALVASIGASSADPSESLLWHNMYAKDKLDAVSSQLDAQRALPEDAPGRDAEIARLEQERAAVLELIDALNELNTVQQRVGSASGTRPIESSYGLKPTTDSYTGTSKYRKFSPTDQAAFNVLESTKNNVAAKLRDETDPTLRDNLRQSLNAATQRTIAEVLEPKARNVFDPVQIAALTSSPMTPEETLVTYNEMAQYNLGDLSKQLAAQEALPEGSAGREDAIDSLKKEIVAVEELISVLTELNAIEQRVGSASGTRNVNSPYGTSSGTGTGTSASKYYSRKAKEDEQVLLQLARNSFDQSAGSMGIAGGTTATSRKFLTDLTRSTATTMINSSGIQDPGMASDIAAIAATSPEVQTAYDESAKSLKDFSSKVGGTITDVAEDLYTVVSGLEALKSALTPLAATSPQAAAALAVVQTAIDETSAAGKEQRGTAGVIETDNRKKVSLVEEQMQAAASRPGFFAGGRREREMRQIQEGYIRDTFGQQGLDALMHRGRIRAYTATGKRVDMAQATVQEQRDTVDRLQKQGINITAEDMTGIARMSGRVEQTKRSAPMGDKLFYAASKIRDVGTVFQTVTDVVSNLASVPTMASNMIGQFASTATGSNRVMTTARGLALSPENYQAALGAADLQRKQFGGSLTSNLSQVSSFIPLSNAYGVDISKTVKVARKLAAFDPAQGMEGASIAIKEFLSGNVSSLSRRFEINRSALSKINTGDADQMLDSLDQVLSGMGVTDRLIDEQAASMATKYDKIVGNLESAQIGITTGLVEFITPTLESLFGAQSYIGKNLRERSLDSLVKESITSYGDDALTDKDTGLASVKLFGSAALFSSSMDEVIEAANQNMMEKAGEYNAATGVTTKIAPYRLVGNMKPEERRKLQSAAINNMLGGMNQTQAIMQAMRDNQLDYNISSETNLQRESLSELRKSNPAEYAKRVADKQTQLEKFKAQATKGMSEGSKLNKGNIERQVDIDTYDVRLADSGDVVRVRLPGIDAPESGTKYDMRGRAVAADVLKMKRSDIGRTLNNQGPIKEGVEVSLVGDLKDKDDSGRVVASILSKDGKNLSVELVAAGEAAVSFIDGMDVSTKYALQMSQKLSADLGLGSINKSAFQVGMGGTPVISDEVRSQYFNNKYLGGLGTSAGIGGAAGYGALAGLGALGGGGSLAALTGAVGLVGVGGAIGLGAAVAGAGYYGYATMADNADESPEKMRELLKMQAAQDQLDLEAKEFSVIAEAANDTVGAKNGFYVGGLTQEYIDNNREIRVARQTRNLPFVNDGSGWGSMRRIRDPKYTNLEYDPEIYVETEKQVRDLRRQKEIVGRSGNIKEVEAIDKKINYLITEDFKVEAYIADLESKLKDDAIKAASPGFAEAIKESSAKAQENYASSSDFMKRVLAREVVNPITNQREAYGAFEAQATALETFAQEGGDAVLLGYTTETQEEQDKLKSGTIAFKANEKVLTVAEKYGLSVDAREFAEIGAQPLRDEKAKLEEDRNEALAVGATFRADQLTTEIAAKQAEIDAITFDDAEWAKVPAHLRRYMITVDALASASGDQIAFASAEAAKQLNSMTDYQVQAKAFTDSTMDRAFQRRQQRFETTTTAFARQAIMGLGKASAPDLTARELGSSGGAGLVIDNTVQARAQNMMLSSGFMPENPQYNQHIIKELTTAQQAAVEEQLNIARTNRQVALSNAPEAQLYKSGFTNFVMAMNLAGATAEDLGRSFMNTMNMMSEGNPRYGLDLAQQMTGFNYETMIGLQLRPRGNNENGDPISSLNGLNGQPYSGSGPMVMPYTSGPRGTIAYSRDMMAVGANGVREGALGIAPSQWQQFVSNATNANAELQRRAMSNAIQERDLNKNHLRNLEDITRNGMRQLESIHLNYTRNMFQLTQQADLVKNMNRANMQRSVATADIFETDRTQINKNIWARDMRAQHFGQGRADLFLESPDLATLTAIDPTLETDIAALQTASNAYDQNVDYYDPETAQNLQNEKLTKMTPVLDKLKTAYANEKDPLKKAVIEKAIMTLSPDPNATLELQNANVQETQFELGDAVARKQLGTQISDMEWQRSYRGLDIANNQQSMVEASKSKDPLALLNAGRSTDAMNRGFAQADAALSTAQTNLSGLVATAPMLSTAYGQVFKNIDQNGTTAFQNVLNGVDDFSISFQQQMEDALRNFDRQRLDMIQAFADAAVEIASIVPKEMIPIMQATSAFMNTQRQAELLWLSGRTDEANALAYQGMLKLGEVVYGEGKGKEYADKYSQNFQDMADVAARDVPQGDLGKFAVKTEDGWALLVKETKSARVYDRPPANKEKETLDSGSGPFVTPGGKG